jgi:ABC-type multidrug transport system ATPase subunit
LSLELKNGETLGLLGPNGAGSNYFTLLIRDLETTAIQILCGITDQTSGDVFVNGYNINTQLSKIRQNLGYSPQHPILFKDLSVLGHLLFYSRLKGIPAKYELINAKNILKYVKLDGLTGSNSIATRLSGGMQQRLSLAISLIGNPGTVILDEPSSGLDPYTKREVWTIISKIKQNKCVLLTTHSLEEADVLCDKIGILAKGRLQCIGNQSHLKNKFGNNYHLMINCDKKKIEEVKKYISELLPSSELGRSFGGHLIFKVQKKDMKIVDLIDKIEEEKVEHFIYEWAVSDTTLEDVFMNIVKE